MLQFLKNLFSPKKQTKDINAPGRTFKRILTGEYFGYKDDTLYDSSQVKKAKQRKLNQIKELSLSPYYIRYTYDATSKNSEIDKIKTAYVVFQKEVFAEKWNMVHVTEISFTIYANDFQEFEEMSGYSLTNDFRDLTSYNKDYPIANERRKKHRTYIT